MMRGNWNIIAAFCFLGFLRIANAESTDAQWDYRFAAPGIRDGIVMAMHFDNDSIFVGGMFETVGRVPANGFAHFDGTKWHNFPNGPVQQFKSFNLTSLEKFDGKLYLGGHFTNVAGMASGGLAALDNANWSVPGVTNGIVNALRRDTEGLLVGGRFFIPGMTNPVALARWNGSDWTDLNSEMSPCDDFVCLDGVWEMQPVGSFVFSVLQVRISDPFSSGLPAYLLASWNPFTGWANFTGPDGDTNGIGNYTLAQFDGKLVVGGDFVNPNNSSIRNVALWDGAVWQPLGNGLDGQVFSLAANEQYLFALHSVNATNQVPSYRVSRWNGIEWSMVGTNDITRDAFRVFVGPDSQLYLSGLFMLIGQEGFSGLVRWNGTGWHSVFEGRYEGLTGGVGTVVTLAEHNGSLYAGGAFTVGNHQVMQGLAHWNGTNWTNVGGSVIGSLSGHVRAITSSGPNLFAGGAFTNMGGTTALNIAQWDGSAWHALDAGLNNNILALAWWENSLYAGGRFTASGSNSVSHIAKWDGSAWTPLGSGCNSNVVTLAVWNNELYAGGLFTTAGGVSSPRIARWNGTAWNNVGTGAWSPSNAVVRQIAAGADGLYVVGQFTHASGVAATNVARWDGANWHPVGEGIGADVTALTTREQVIFAGGQTTNSANQRVGTIYRFDGTNWNSLGNGVSGLGDSARVLSLLATTNEVFVGGLFTMAGQRPAANIARWIEHPNPHLEIVPDTQNGRISLQIKSDPGLAFAVESTLHLQDWSKIWQGAGGDYSLDLGIPAQEAEFFRTISSPLIEVE